MHRLSINQQLHVPAHKTLKPADPAEGSHPLAVLELDEPETDALSNRSPGQTTDDARIRVEHTGGPTILIEESRVALRVRWARDYGGSYQRK